MKKKLTAEDLTGLKNLSIRELIRQLEFLANRKYRIDLQYEGGIEYKHPDKDPDVKKLYDDYQAVLDEAKSRLRSATEKNKLMEFLDASNQASALNVWDGGALGIPARNLTKSQKASYKNTYKSLSENVLNKLQWQ